MSTTDNKSQIHALTGVRVYALILIFLFLLNWDFFEHLFPAFFQIFSGFIWSGFTSVDLFYLLSGFIIAYHYHDIFQRFNGSTYVDYLIKRFARIYPVYLVSLLLLVLLAIVKYGSLGAANMENPAVFSSAGLWESAFLLQSWKVPASTDWNDVAWSVSAEWLAYLLFPAFVMVLSKIQSRRQIWCAAVLIFALLPLSIYVHFMLTGQLQTHRGYGLFRILVDFPLGILVFKYYQLHRQTPPPQQPKLHNAILIFLMLGLLLPVSFLWAIPLYAIAIYWIAIGRLSLNRLLSHRIAVYGGQLSYSFYLIHGVLLVVYRELWPAVEFADSHWLIQCLYLGSYIGASLVLSILCFHGVEEAARRKIIGAYKKISP